MAYSFTSTTLAISNPSLEASKKHSMSMAPIAALRRAASAAVPLAVSVASRQSIRVNSVYLNNLSGRTAAAASLVAFSRSSSSSHAKDLEPLGSDSDIIEAINKEIKSTAEAHVNQVKAIRDEFHFEIYDDEASDFIILRRKFGKETIEIEAYLEDANDDESVEIDETTTTSSSSTSEDEEKEGEVTNIEVKDEKEEEGEDDEDLYNTKEKRELAFMVTVSKDEGRKLVFSCIGDGEDFMIKDVFFEVKKGNKEGEEDGADEGLTFNDLSLDLQRVFYKYLERRGVLPSTLRFLQDYMVNKERRGYLDWLNKMKQFIES